MIIFEFCYSSCIHEEGMITISLHKTEKGAIKAMRKHKREEKKKWKKVYPDKKAVLFTPFGKHEHWAVGERKIHE